MKWYIITQKAAENVDTPVLEAGSDEAVAVFTRPEAAQKYLEDASWSSDYVVAELTPVAFLELIVAARDNGTTLGVIDPNREEHLRGEPQNVFSILECLEETAAWLGNRLLRSDEGRLTPSQLGESADELEKHTTPSELMEAAERET